VYYNRVQLEVKKKIVNPRPIGCQNKERKKETVDEMLFSYSKIPFSPSLGSLKRVVTAREAGREKITKLYIKVFSYFKLKKYCNQLYIYRVFSHAFQLSYCCLKKIKSLFVLRPY
jgi:hypothetical protein